MAKKKASERGKSAATKSAGAKKKAKKRAKKSPKPQAAKGKPDKPAAQTAKEAAPAVPSAESTAATRSSVVLRGKGLELRPGRDLVHLSRRQIESLPWEPGEIARHVEIALREHGRGKVELAVQTTLHPQREALLSAMPALVPNVQACGLKWFSTFPSNIHNNLPQVSAIAVLSDPHTGMPLATMDGSWLTAQRGPAVSAVAAKALARPGARTAAIIGGGVQGRNHIPALVAALSDLETIRVFDIQKTRAADATRGWRGKLARRVKIEAAGSAADAVRNADVLVSATSITSKPHPSVAEGWVRSGALVLPLDLDAVFEPAVFEKADRVFVDSPEDLDILRSKGLFKKGLPQNIAGTLGEAVCGKVDGRGADAERIVCLNVGVSCVDIVLARAIYEKALRTGVGTILEL